MSNSRFYRVWLPLGLSMIALVIINFGLYVQLSATPAESHDIEANINFPYVEDFVSDTVLDYPRTGGDWEMRDETLVQISTTGYDLGWLIPLTVDPTQPYRLSVDLRYLEGTMGGGVLFNAQQTNTRQQSHMVRFNVDDDTLYLIFGYFDDENNFFGQGSVETPLSPTDNAWHRLEVIVNENGYRFALDDETLTGDVTLMYEGGYAGLVASTSQVAFDNLTLTAISDSPTEVIANDNPSVEVIDLNANSLLTDGDTAWTPISGTWVFNADGFTQSETSGFDYSTVHNGNFSDYRLRVTFTHDEGRGGGVVFNLPDANTLNGGHMVRYVHNENYLMWGYFDADGAFVGQGSVAVPAPATGTHTLDVISGDSTYDIALDGEVVAVNLPLNNTSGHIGLVTAQSAVTFDNVEIYGANVVSGGVSNVAPSPTTNTETASFDNMTLNAVNGDWQFGEAITQSATDQVDYVAGTGIAAETFTISVDITLPESNAVGAGLIFHMAGRDDFSGGQMVRFGSGGTEIFWGSYDADRTFSGMGGTPLTLDWTEPHTLTLIVDAGSYDIRVDDTVIVTGVPLSSEFGWIGVISFGGEITFSNLELSIG